MSYRLDRYNMIRLPIYMEKSGIDEMEWVTMVNIVQAMKPIRKYIMDFAQDLIAMEAGLKPKFPEAVLLCDIAYIAAEHIKAAALAEMHEKSKKHLADLLETPAPLSDEQHEDALRRYYQQRLGTEDTKVTAKLKAAMERESSIIDGKPFTTSSGCRVIPFSMAKKSCEGKMRGW